MVKTSIIQQTSKSRWAEVAPGFEVRQSIPFSGHEAVGPIILFDHFGPKPMAPGRGSGTGAHPHAGFETLSYFLEGESSHSDSLGNRSTMGAGDAQWMRAGRGIVHDEGLSSETASRGGQIQGFQIWINLPAAHKLAEPEYRQIGKDSIPVVRLAEGVEAHVIAGSLAGVTGPVRTFSDPLVVHLKLSAGVATHLKVEAPEAALYAAQGQVYFDEGEAPVGTLALLQPGGGEVAIRTESESHVFLIGGAPLDAPIVRYGPFVMNTQAQLRESIARYQAGAFGEIEG